MKSSNNDTKKLGKVVIYILFKNAGKQVLLLIYSLYKSNAWQDMILWPGSSDICIDAYTNTGKVQVLQPVLAPEDKTDANSYAS